MTICIIKVCTFRFSLYLLCILNISFLTVWYDYISFSVQKFFRDAFLKIGVIYFDWDQKVPLMGIIKINDPIIASYLMEAFYLLPNLVTNYNEHFSHWYSRIYGCDEKSFLLQMHLHEYILYATTFFIFFILHPYLMKYKSLLQISWTKLLNLNLYVYSRYCICYISQF